MGISLSFVIPYCMANLRASRQFNYDAQDQTRFFRRIHFEYFCLTSFFPSHGASNSQVSEVSKILFMFFYDVRSAMDGSWKCCVLKQAEHRN